MSGKTGNGGVTLTGNKNSPGSKGSSGKSGTGKGKGKDHKPPKTPTCTGLPEACQTFTVIPAPAPSTPGRPGVTISDLKTFKPTPGTDHMEPNGWMVVGLPTNFYSVVGLEVRNGKLLGYPASVRFRPISWHWAYGDHTTAVKPTAGNTWAAERIPEFTATSTSHTYSKPGTYYIDLSIVFRAEYKWAGGNWIPLTGTITLPANRLKASAGSAKTVLVARDCLKNPSGPGC